jgi:hypothetical protein
MSPAPTIRVCRHGSALSAARRIRRLSSSALGRALPSYSRRSARTPTRGKPELVPAADQVGAAHLRRALENGHSQEQAPGITPENLASAVAQPGEVTPENAELLARYGDPLQRFPLTGPRRGDRALRPAQGDDHDAGSCLPGGCPSSGRSLAALLFTAVTCPSLKFLACRHGGGACRCRDPGIGPALAARL